MSVAELETRLRDWIEADYRAVLFEMDSEVVAYALYRSSAGETYLRHFFVLRHRRRQGVGRTAMGLLRHHIWPKNERLTVSVLTQNEAGLKFWREMGYRDYCLTMEIPPQS